MVINNNKVETFKLQPMEFWQKYRFLFDYEMNLVAKPRIELGFSASETLVLTIVRQGHKQNYEIAPITFRRNITLIAAGKKIDVGRLSIIRISSIA